MENDSLFSLDIRNLLHSLPWPKHLRIDIVERTAADHPYLQMVLYRDNFNHFDGEERFRISMLVKQFMEKVRGMGIPIYLEVAPGNGGLVKGVEHARY